MSMGDFKTYVEKKVAKFIYTDAGGNAPAKVKEAIEEFRALPEKERAKRPMLYWILGGGTPDFKIEQEDADYTDKSKVEEKTCANCEYAYQKVWNKKYLCSWVKGEINPEGWSKYWKKGE